MKSKINRSQKADSIKRRSKKINKIESSIKNNMIRLKVEKKKLNEDVSELVNSYPSVNSKRKWKEGFNEKKESI